MQPTAFYDRWFSERLDARPTISKRILFREVRLLIESFLDREPAKVFRLLDVGCGAGHLIDGLLRFDRLALSGVDITDSVIGKLKNRYPSVSFASINYAEPQPELKERFDLITAVEILEHIPYSSQSVFIHNLSRSLVPGGRLMLTTPDLDRAHRIPKAFQNTQPVEDWVNRARLEVLLDPFFEDIRFGSCILYFPNRVVDILFKRLLYPFHMGLEQTLIRNTAKGCHIVATAKKKSVGTLK